MIIDWQINCHATKGTTYLITLIIKLKKTYLLYFIMTLESKLIDEGWLLANLLCNRLKILASKWL